MSQNRPRVPQDAEVKPPIMPNDKFASQKYQDPLATLPRICNPETMSNDRGLAAEGVAHKIKKFRVQSLTKSLGYLPGEKLRVHSMKTQSLGHNVVYVF